MSIAFDRAFVPPIDDSRAGALPTIERAEHCQRSDMSGILT
jgi:hypothetical protein